MLKRDFDAFLVEKEKKHEEIDWEAKKNEWLSKLSDLYKLFEESLKYYVEKGKVKVTYDDVTIPDEYIGTYNAQKMTIEFAGEKITLEPIGTNLIGVSGRVDMIGKFGSAKMVLVDSRMKGIRDHIKVADEETDEPISLEWKFVTPERLYLLVDEDTIYSAIMELSNGR